MDNRFMPWTTDPAVHAAWQAHVHDAAATPWRWRELMQRKGELFPRFAAIYHRLYALPRWVQRRLQRQWACSLAGVALLFALQPTTSWAANFTAGTAADLIVAINAANSDSAADTITLTADITLVEAVSPIDGPTGLPVITSPITIAGQGHTIHRDSGAPDFRLLEVSNTGDLTPQDTTLSGGTGTGGGGGILNSGGSLTLTDSTVSGNSAAVSFSRYGSGGCILNFLGSVTLTNSTVSGNSATGSGGGIYNYAGSVTLSRSLVSGNTAPTAAEVFIRPGSSVTDTFNLLGHNGLSTAQAVSGFIPDPSDITATSDGNDPTALADILDPTLQNNGGPTLTHNLVPGSPAIDAAGPDCPPPATDQRGVTRPLGAACDMGAVEFSFAFSAFFAPIDNPPALNVVKAGQGIPVKFSLDGNQGLNILETGYPKSQQIACDTAEPADDIEATVTAGSGGLSYNSSTDQYTYGWKTVTTWANTCRQFIVKLTNGAVRLANFQFKK